MARTADTLNNWVDLRNFYTCIAKRPKGRFFMPSVIRFPDQPISIIDFNNSHAAIRLGPRSGG